MARFDVEAIVFDLDGTLIDSKQDIADALNWTLAKLGYEPLNLPLIESFVGNGVQPLLKRSLEQAGHAERMDESWELFRDRYWNHLLDTTRLFNSVGETIETLRGGYKMGVVSNKPELYTKKIITELGLDPVFGGAVYGGDTLPVKKPDPAALIEMSGRFGVPMGKFMIVGDSNVDIFTGKNAGAVTVGVSYGYRTVEELVEAGADAMIDRFDQLLGLLA